MAPICIREFDFERDYGPAVRLWEGIEKGIHVGTSDSASEIHKKLERDPDLFLVAEAAGELIATVIGGYDGRRGFIYHLAVHATKRSRGVGGQLMEEVERRLRAKGCRRCYLLVTPDNLEAMHYYESRGWQLMNVHPYAKDLD